MEKKSKMFEMYESLGTEEKKGMMSLIDFLVEDMAKKDIEMKAFKLFKDLGKVASNSLNYIQKTENEEEKNDRAEKLCGIYEQFINILKDFQKGN